MGRAALAVRFAVAARCGVTFPPAFAVRRFAAAGARLAGRFFATVFRAEVFREVAFREVAFREVAFREAVFRKAVFREVAFRLDVLREVDFRAAALRDVYREAAFRAPVLVRRAVEALAFFVLRARRFPVRRADVDRGLATLRRTPGRLVDAFRLAMRFPRPSPKVRFDRDSISVVASIA